MHLTKGLKHFLTVHCFFDPHSLLLGRQLDKALRDFSSLENENLPNLTMVLKGIENHIVAELKDNRVVDAH